ncbi:MAG TPA: cellulose synthase complex periplasmic endoglucanase BcsZ [Terracidiphilus sp.]
MDLSLRDFDHVRWGKGLDHILVDFAMGRGSKRALVLLAVFLIAVASGGCRQGPWTLWEAYAGHFINADGRVVEHSVNDRTTSEGQSYALFFALAANDRPRFDKILAWTQGNLASGDLGKRLPGWQWGKAPDGQWKLLDPNSASDADCWIAYSLLEAGRLWNNSAYTQLGRQMLTLIARQEVADLPGFGAMLLPGPANLWVHNNVWTVNPSYLPLFQFQRFDEVDSAGPWGAILMNIPRFLRLSAKHGYAMDWVDYVPGDGFYPAPPPGSAPPEPPQKPSLPVSVAKAANPQPANPPGPAPQPAVGSYDAIRVYLWAGMIDPSGNTRRQVLDGIPGIGAFLGSGDHVAPPEKITAQGIPEPQPGPVGFSAALLPYVWAQPEMARIGAQLRVRVGAERNPDTGLYGKQPVYYDQNLVLFAMGYLDNRFWFGPRGEMRVEWTR